jgi:hypothetical protein
MTGPTAFRPLTWTVMTVTDREKTIRAWLVIDWRSGDHRTRKQKPSQSELGTNELVTEIKVDVGVPNVDVPTLSAKIDVPEPRVYAATMEALDDDDLPDWTVAANDAIDNDSLAIKDAPAGDMDRITDSIIARTLMNAPGRPDPELVQDYVRDMAAQIRGDADE